MPYGRGRDQAGGQEFIPGKGPWQKPVGIEPLFLAGIRDMLKNVVFCGKL